METEQEGILSRIRSFISQFSTTQRVIVITLLIIFAALLAFLPLSSRLKQRITPPISPPSQSRIWEMTFAFDTRSKTLSLKKIQIEKGVAYPSPFKLSAYKLMVLDKNKKTLFETYIMISEQIIFNIDITKFGTSSAKPLQPEIMETIVAIPYFESAASIQVFKEGILILEFSPPKLKALLHVPQAQAQTAACSSVINVVFVSDGYSDFNLFHQHVESAKQAFLSTQPYASSPQVLDLSRVIDNPVSNQLGCISGGYFNHACVVYSQQTISSLVFSKYPDLPRDNDHTKFMVLANAPSSPVYRVLGAVNGLGGQYGAFEFLDRFGPTTAVHELLGHAVGYLYDRYLADVLLGARAGLIDGIRNNCTDDANGEPFWRNVGVNQGYQGCYNSSLYAPGPRTCANPAGGTPESIMSAGGCAGPNFDKVEQEWIRTEIIPRYTSCPTTGGTPTPTIQVTTPTPTPSPTPTLSPTPTTILTPTSTPSISPKPPLTSTPTPTAATSGGGGTSTGGASAPSEEEPVTLYDCHERQGTQTVNGRQIQVSWLECTPIQ